MQKFDFSYNSKEDDLFVFQKRAKSAGAVEIGPVVLDMDKKGNVIALQFLNASEYLSSSTGMEIGKMQKILKNLSGCQLDTKIWRNNLLMVKLILLAGEMETVWNFSIPQVSQASPVSSL